MHQARHDADSYQRVELITGSSRRRRWSAAEKARIVTESADPEANVSEVARRNGVSRGLLNIWRRQARQAPREAGAFVRLRVAEGCEEGGSSKRATGRFDRRRRTHRDCDRRRDGAGSGRRRCTHVGAGARGAEVGAVISFGRDVRVFVATEPIDFRKGVHGLVALVAEGLAGAPYSGDVFVFRSTRSDRLKILAFDGTGMVLASKWLEEGNFAWPPARAGTMHVTGAQLAMLIEGLSEWSQVVTKPTRRPTKVV